MKHIKKTTIALALSALYSLSAHAAPVQYKIDPEHTIVQFKVPHLDYSYILGTFNNLSGQYTYDSETGEISNVEFTLNTDSLDTYHGERNKHLRGTDFLNTAAQPQASFKSSAWQDGQLTGELTLNGQTQTITVPVNKIGEGDDPWGSYRTGFETTFNIVLSDYQIPDSYVKQAEIYITGEGIRQ